MPTLVSRRALPMTPRERARLPITYIVYLAGGSLVGVGAQAHRRVIARIRLAPEKARRFVLTQNARNDRDIGIVSERGAPPAMREAAKLYRAVPVATVTQKMTTLSQPA